MDRIHICATTTYVSGTEKSVTHKDHTSNGSNIVHFCNSLRQCAFDREDVPYPGSAARLHRYTSQIADRPNVPCAGGSRPSREVTEAEAGHCGAELAGRTPSSVITYVVGAAAGADEQAVATSSTATVREAVYHRRPILRSSGGRATCNISVRLRIVSVAGVAFSATASSTTQTCEKRFTVAWGYRQVFASAVCLC